MPQRWLDVSQWQVPDSTGHILSLYLDANTAEDSFALA